MSSRSILLVSAAGLFLLASVYVSSPVLARGALMLGDGFFGGRFGYDLVAADLLYRGALSLDPRNPHAWHQRARIDFLEGEFDGALQKIERQISLHGEDFMASYYIRGLIHGYRKEFREAERDFRAFLSWDPDNWAANNDLAWIYFSEGAFEDSFAVADEALAVAPQNPWLLIMRGMSSFNLGREGEALADLEQAKAHADALTEEDWKRAYPGNDPHVAAAGLSAMREAIDENLSRVRKGAANQTGEVY